MIEVYRAETLLDDYRGVWYQDQDEPLFDLFRSGERIGDRWRIPRLILRASLQRAISKVCGA
jgi:hypothetical protein